MKTKIERIIKDGEYKKGQRGNWDNYRQDVAQFVLPRKAWITTVKVNGARLQDDFLYDSRAILALKEAACGFHSRLTNPASRWYESRTLNEKFMQSGAIQRYFKEVDDIQFDVINNTNWDETMLEFYTDDLTFGVAAILSEEDEYKEVRYTSVPIEQINTELNDRGEVCRVWRYFKFTALQCKMRWKENISEAMAKAIADGKWYEKFEILHYVSERYERDVKKGDNRNMEFESLWIAVKEEHKLSESGFEEMPYHHTRFWVHSDDDDGGYSPAMDVLASIKVVNAEKRTIIRKAQKDADPATMAPMKFWVAPLNFNPSAMNYYDATRFKPEMFQPIQTGGNLQQAVEIMNIEQELIDRGFFIPLFRSLSNVTKQMTVPEVQQRIAEGLALIGPVVGRMTKTIKSSLLRTYGILDRRGLFPPPPKQIQGQDLNINFLSPLAKAQRQSEINGLMAWMEFVGKMAEIWPQAKDGVDVDFVSAKSRDLLGVDPNAIFEEEKIKEIRANQAQLQMKQMQIEQADVAARAAAHGAEAHKLTKEAGAIK